MSGGSRLAHNLDESMLTRAIRRPVALGSKVGIACRGTPDYELIAVSGPTVAAELGGRYLVRYVTRAAGLRECSGHWWGPTYVSPTPYSASEAGQWLALPGRRSWYLLIDPAAVGAIAGPRYVQFGNGIEYLLPYGFSKEAVVAVGTDSDARWPLAVS
jgi:hypothetical protein